MQNEFRFSLALKGLLLALTLILCSSSGLAGWYEAIAAYKRGDHATAHKHWLALARGGDTEAQFNLGVMHRSGIGVPKKFENALVWFKRAAARGHLKARINLGSMFANGEGGPPNYPEAIKLYRLVSEQGHPRGHFELGRMYMEGKGVPLSTTRAIQLFKQAAEQSYPNAQYQLAVMNERALGMPQDKISAYMWYSVAASNLNGEARAWVQSRFETLLKTMTPSEIAQAAIRAAQQLRSTKQLKEAQK